MRHYFPFDDPWERHADMMHTMCQLWAEKYHNKHKEWMPTRKELPHVKGTKPPPDKSGEQFLAAAKLIQRNKNQRKPPK